MTLRNTPYSRATGGASARDEISKLLRAAGCTSIGFMDDFERHELILQFEHRNRKVVLRASAKGWAALHIRNFPYNNRMKVSAADYHARALAQGMVAINSILRDWVKGQITAIECGVFSFDAVFMPYMLLPGGQSVAERIDSMRLLSSEVENGAPKAR
jgi:hypothetical protein